MTNQNQKNLSKCECCHSPPESRLSEEDKKLLKNWRKFFSCQKYTTVTCGFCCDQRTIIIKLLKAKDHEAAEKVREAVEKERKRCIAIVKNNFEVVFEDGYGTDQYLEALKELSEPPKD